MLHDTEDPREQTQQTAVESAEVVRELRKQREQMARLAALVEQQQARMEQQEGELRELRASSRSAAAGVTSKTRASARYQTSGRASNRRALLKLGGAAAAAATVALVTSEGKSAQAASLTDGNNVTAGNAVSAEHPTVINYNGASGDAKIILLANDSEFTPSGSSVAAALAGWVGTGSTSGNNTGIYGFSGIAGGNGVLAYSPVGFGLYANGSDSSTSYSGVAYPALYAIQTGSGNGVEAQGADNRTAVYAHVGGISGNGVEAYASGSEGYGVWGISDVGWGVVGQTTTGVDVHVGGNGGTGRLAQRLQASAGAPTSGSYSIGEQIRDDGGNLYICVASGSPGIWMRVAAIPAGAVGGASVFFSQPYRIFDTRDLAGVPFNNGAGNFPMTVSEIKTLQITGTVDPMNSSIVVPSGAAGIIADLIAITPSGSGFLGIQPSTGSHNPYAWVNYTSGVTIHNSVVVGLSDSGKVDIECSTASSGAALTLTGYII